jgi:hypothetical protein
MTHGDRRKSLRNAEVRGSIPLSSTKFLEGDPRCTRREQSQPALRRSPARSETRVDYETESGLGGAAHRRT